MNAAVTTISPTQSFAPRVLASQPLSLTVAPLVRWTGIHILLAIAMLRLPIVGTAHAMISIAVGMMFASSGAPKLRVAKALAYITAAEILWRMANAPIIFWEAGKYALVAIACLSLPSARPVRRSALPSMYILLLLPSSMFTVATLSLSAAKGQLSFNLSGPLALSACAAFFCRARFTLEDAAHVMSCALGPLAGLLGLTAFATLTAKKLHFDGESNFVSSAGYGPNQVSAVLGFGALFAILLAVIYAKRLPSAVKWFLYMLALAFAGQSALTFSRTGIYLVCLSLAAASTYLLRDPRLRYSVLAGGAFCYFIANVVIAPRLDELTHGKLGERFADKGLSRRGELMRLELATFAKHPVLGVGPGMGRFYRPRGWKMAAHTEFTRLLSEHGLFGLAAMSMLAWEAWQSLRRTTTLRSRALVSAILGFGLCFMIASGMRLALPSFVIGFAFCTFVDD